MSTFQLTDPQRAFLDGRYYAVVGTLNHDGTIQQTVVWYILEEGEIRFHMAAASVKARNLRRNPALTFTIHEGGRYLTLSGTGTVEPPDTALRERIARRYLAPDRVAEWLARRVDAARVSARMTITRAYGQGV